MSMVIIPLTNEAGEIAVNPSHVSWVLPGVFPSQSTLYMDGGQPFQVALEPRGLVEMLGADFVALTTSAPAPGNVIFVNTVQAAQVEAAGTGACWVLAGGVKQQVVGTVEQVLTNL